MHIVLLILKILGILLLVILGLLLLILCTVLFVPVRYRIQGLWKEEKWIRVQVSWLLSLVSFRGGYDMKKGLTGSLQVLWFRLWEMEEKTKEQETEQTETEKEKKKPEQIREEERIEDQKIEDQEKGELVQAMEVSTDEDEKKTLIIEEIKTKSEVNNEKKTHNDLQSNQPLKRPEKKENSKNFEKKPHNPDPESYLSLSQRIKAIWIRILMFFQKLKFSFLHFCDKLKNIKTFIQEKKEWLEDEKNQESFRLLFKQFKKLLSHVWPCRGKGTVTFGLEDPYYTGQILAGASLLYPFFYKRLTLQPVFDEKCLEAELDYRGRVRVSYLLWLFWGIFHHKHTWKMIRGFMNRDNSSDE